MCYDTRRAWSACKIVPGKSEIYGENRKRNFHFQKIGGNFYEQEGIAIGNQLLMFPAIALGKWITSFLYSK